MLLSQNHFRDNAKDPYDLPSQAIASGDNIHSWFLMILLQTAMKLMMDRRLVGGRLS
jgi:hypothetical protein